jgi:hypothetical protein
MKISIDHETELRKLYTALSHQTGFPTDFCQKTSLLAATHIPGLYAVGGKFRLDTPMVINKTPIIDVPHWWIEDSSQKIFELTGTQFNRQLKIPFSDGVVSVTEKHPHFSRYLRIEGLSSKFRPLID